MARALTANFITEATAALNRPVLLFEAQFASNPIYLASANYDLSWNSKTWLGNGWLYGVSEITETSEVDSVAVDVMLAGIPPAILALVLQDAAQGKTGRVYYGFLNSSGAVIADPFLAFEGKLDVPVITESPDGAVVNITYETRLVDFDRAREYRYTKESQKIFYPSDKGFDFVPSLQDWNGFFGTTKKEKPPKKKKK